MGVEFGTALKTWRTQRRMSQLDLGLTAEVSSRTSRFWKQGWRGQVEKWCCDCVITLLRAIKCRPRRDWPRPMQNGRCRMLTWCGFASCRLDAKAAFAVSGLCARTPLDH
ncbi:MAG: hypothetical protein ACI92Z_002543 [Paracoccaceae bacterium]|jgi:hypothetical protein